jgi:ABC-2 type transport system permease protein
MAAVLRAVSDLLPLSYAVDAMSRVTARGADARVWLDLGVVAACAALALALGAATLRRRSD